MGNEDAEHWEKEISDIMENLRRFQAALAEGRSAIIEDVFKFQPSEEYSGGKQHGEGDDLKASLAEMEKLDALLKVKNTEEKRARLSRLRVEEESRTILATLTSVTMTTRIKMNSDEFLRLLHDANKPGSDEEEATGEGGDKGDDEKDGKKQSATEVKNLKPSGSQQKLKFVERNIQLAKCGRGVLSLTDEEKLRIESLLIDIADPKPEESEKKKVDDPMKLERYALDDDSKSILTDIDQKLEAFSKEEKRSESRMNLLDSLKVEEDAMKETGKKKSKKRKKPPTRLLAINKLLNRISSTTDEEISPLSPEEINRLIEEASRSSAEVESKPPPEVIAGLVSNAKLLMPKFKYRFGEG